MITNPRLVLERMLTVPEAADILRCTADCVYRLVRRRRLVATKNGRSVLISPSDLSDYIQRNRTDS